MSPLRSWSGRRVPVGHVKYNTLEKTLLPWADHTENMAFGKFEPLFNGKLWMAK